jgi:hypothetical protein
VSPFRHRKPLLNSSAAHRQPPSSNLAVMASTAQSRQREDQQESGLDKVQADGGERHHECRSECKDIHSDRDPTLPFVPAAHAYLRCTP